MGRDWGHRPLVEKGGEGALSDGQTASNSANLPVLSEEARMANLVKAAAARTARANFLRDLKAGRASVAQSLGDPGDLVGKVPVRTFLKSCPGIGDAKADHIMERVGISPNRRVRGLGRRQRDELIAILCDD